MAIQQDKVISIKGSCNTANTLLYSVPAGRTCIICDWFICNRGNTNVSVSVRMGGINMIPGTYATPGSKYVENNCKIILTAGDTIEVTSSSMDLEYYFSGIEEDVALY